MKSPLRQRTIADSKVRDYLLNNDHPHGKAKAEFFSIFGFASAEWQAFRESLHEHPERNPIFEVIKTEFGMKYVVCCNLTTPDGRDPCVKTVWMTEDGREARLVTAYPAGQ